MINLGTAAPRVGDAENKGHGRWRLNSGSEMKMTILGISDEPVRTVVDFGTAKAAGERIVALFDHDHNRVIGYWDRLVISSQGVDGDLHLIDYKEGEEEVFADVIRVAGIARSGVPIEVSVSAKPEDNESDWVHVPPGETVSLNGRDYCGDGEYPLYYMKNARIFEASIVTFGADSVTGRIAAHKTSPVKQEEDRMSDKLKALLGKYTEKHHGLVARRFVAGIDEATIHNEIHAAELDEKDAKIKAMESEIEALKAECTSLKASIMEDKGDTAAVEHNSAPGVINEEKNILPTSSAGRSVAAGKKVSDKVIQAARSSNTGITARSTDEGAEEYPKTLSAAMNHEINKGTTLKGEKLRNFVITKHPDIERA
jgi:hypothetical protein